MAGNVLHVLVWLFQFLLVATVFMRSWTLFHADTSEMADWIKLVVGAVLLVAFGHLLAGYGHAGAAYLAVLLP